ncbi:hypothetical protein DDZ13_15180 [Coraliomargarita sinensis]|uniref:Uncharacterized protein n=1 Tax=Coraliomargarita sinensis TaxID=2174842 RepID=A0A317ZFV3_9BACT|nr:hypothetical protein [Coraliomargarita sinensis]PXA02818.1 hypothetical protein DDZ13_15180 [Coraliomargarita sinensis]
MNIKRILILLLSIAGCIQSAYSSETEEKLLQLTKEIRERQQKITEILMEHDLKNHASLYELILKESPKDYRETLVYMIARKIREEDLNVTKNEKILGLMNQIIDPSRHAKDYKLHMSEIFFTWELQGFQGKEQSLFNDMPLSMTLSEEAKSFYVSYNSSLMRFLYLSRWLEEGQKKSQPGGGINSEAAPLRDTP